MTHAHSPALPTPMTPWHYIELRRRAAGLSRAQLAASLSRLIKARRRITPAGAVRAWVDLIERPGVRIINPDNLALLVVALPIDVDVYNQLATEPADRHPTLCGSCGVADDAVPVTAGRCRSCRTARRLHKVAA